MNDDTIERLETKIAFLERNANELSDVVYRQQQDIATLNERIVTLTNRVDALKAPDPGYTAEDERPPHY